MSGRRNYPYLPNTDEDREEMLRAIGARSIEDLFSDIPPELREKATLNLPPALSELEIIRYLHSLAAKNIPLGELQDESVLQTPSLVPFLGAGIYDHYVPPAVQHIVSRNEFYTAYTPYQA
ncbi:MAG: hypothetical protein N2116_04935, partial [Armatimonadetes bacterium]|nr:hypothetical protein [Armatimonadota bacterium]